MPRKAFEFQHTDNTVHHKLTRYTANISQCIKAGDIDVGTWGQWEYMPSRFSNK